LGDHQGDLAAVCTGLPPLIIDLAEMLSGTGRAAQLVLQS